MFIFFTAKDQLILSCSGVLQPPISVQFQQPIKFINGIIHSLQITKNPDGLDDVSIAIFYFDFEVSRKVDWSESRVNVLMASSKILIQSIKHSSSLGLNF